MPDIETLGELTINHSEQIREDNPKTNVKQRRQEKKNNNMKVDISENNTCSNEQETTDNSKSAETVDQRHNDGEEYDRKENKAHHHLTLISD